MKKTITFLVVCFSITTLSYSQEAAGLKVFDTRSIADSPSFLKNSIRADFKFRSTVGVPGLGNYSTNVTISPWSEPSGDFNHQLNFNNGGIYYRQGNFNESSWRSWQKILLESSEGNVAVSGTISAKQFFLETAYKTGNWGISELMYEGHTLKIGSPKGYWTYNIIDIIPGSHQTELVKTELNLCISNSLDNYIKKIHLDSYGSTYFNGGNVGIGTENPKHKLDVLGIIRATEVKVETGWADFVFDKDYKLPTLEEVESHIIEYKRLPDIPSEAEVKKDGIGLGEMQVKLLQKIEELTLYVIEQGKEIKQIKEENKELKTQLSKLE